MNYFSIDFGQNANIEQRLRNVGIQVRHEYGDEECNFKFIRGEFDTDQLRKKLSETFKESYDNVVYDIRLIKPSTLTIRKRTVEEEFNMELAQDKRKSVP